MSTEKSNIPKLPEPPVEKTPLEVRTEFHEAKKAVRNAEGVIALNVACPGCAAPDLLKTELLADEAGGVHSCRCTACSRFFTFKTAREKNNVIGYEIIRNSGPALPKWFNKTDKAGEISVTE